MDFFGKSLTCELEIGAEWGEICKRYKDIIFEGIKRYVPQKILSKNPDPQYCNKGAKRLNVKVRKIYD